MDYNDIYWKADPCHRVISSLRRWRYVKAKDSAEDLFSRPSSLRNQCACEIGRPGVRDADGIATLSAFAAPVAAGRVSISHGTNGLRYWHQCVANILSGGGDDGES
jgi:hypothetical protein